MRQRQVTVLGLVRYRITSVDGEWFHTVRVRDERPAAADHGPIYAYSNPQSDVAERDWPRIVPGARFIEKECYEDSPGGNRAHTWRIRFPWGQQRWTGEAPMRQRGSLRV